jgi:hypothetical protein
MYQSALEGTWDFEFPTYEGASHHQARILINLLGSSKVTSARSTI